MVIATTHTLTFRRRLDARERLLAVTVIVVLGYLACIALVPTSAGPIRTIIACLVPVAAGVAWLLSMGRGARRAVALGLTLHGSRQALRDAALFSALAILALTALRWWLSDGVPGLSPQIWSLDLRLRSGLYAVGAVLQEIVARGLLQSGLVLALGGKRRTAVIIAAAVFALMHLHISLTMVALCLALGLAWGWLFARHRTLVGVCFSHAVIGLWGIDVLDGRAVLAVLP